MRRDGPLRREQACPPGHYCLEGTRTSNFTDFGTPERPLPCPFGTYCGPGVTTNRTIANNFTTPQTCFAGYLCEPGSATPQGSGPCPSGHYCPPGQLIPCPSRTYCPGVANTEPKPCIPGLYQQEYGQSSCKKCPLGTICPGFAREVPEPCPPGYVCDAVGLPTPSKRCPAGHYCLQNTLTPDPLSALDIGAMLRASPIALDETQFRPLPCLPATYCTQGVENNVTNEGVYTQPQPCKEGSYCEWGTSDNTFVVAGDVSSPMLPCPPGNYCPKGTYIPIPAPRGNFAPREGNTAAAMCLPGLYTHYEGFQTCLACPAGYECAADGTYKPTVCRSGTVRSLRDSITCKNCPMGTWSPFQGVTDESLCIPCNPGLVCSSEGADNNKPFGDSASQVVNEFIVDCELGLDTCETVELQPLGQAILCPEGYVCDSRHHRRGGEVPRVLLRLRHHPRNAVLQQVPDGLLLSGRHGVVGSVPVPVLGVPLLPGGHRCHPAALSGRHQVRPERGVHRRVHRPTGSRSGACSRSRTCSSTKRTRLCSPRCRRRCQTKP